MEKTLSETLDQWREERKHDARQREYWRTKQRESRERRKPKQPARPAPVITSFVPFNPVIIKGGCSINLDLDELAKLPETHIHAILEGVGKVVAATNGAASPKEGV